MYFPKYSVFDIFRPLPLWVEVSKSVVNAM